MSVEFIQAQSKKDHAIQTAIRALAIIRYGGYLSHKEAKLFIDLLSLSLPMKYRFPREVFEEIKRGVHQTLTEAGLEIPEDAL